MVLRNLMAMRAALVARPSVKIAAPSNLDERGSVLNPSRGKSSYSREQIPLFTACRTAACARSQQAKDGHRVARLEVHLTPLPNIGAPPRRRSVVCSPEQPGIESCDTVRVHGRGMIESPKSERSAL